MSPAAVIQNLLMELEEKDTIVCWCKVKGQYTDTRKEFRIKTLRFC